MAAAPVSIQINTRVDSFLNARAEFPLLWRRHSDRVNSTLINRWLPSQPSDALLKTDLFDEAITEGLYSAIKRRCPRFIGMDLSLPVIRQARLRYPRLRAALADVRSLPFPDSTFDAIVSISTLDHFESFGDMTVSLDEFHRVLCPGGTLILTLDNPLNPVVFLRNHLPFRLLHRLGIVPYFVGKTSGPAGLCSLLRRTGFNILEVKAILHCPRVLAVAMARWVERHASQKTQEFFSRFLTVFERGSCLPTRFITGHFIAVRANKR